MKPCASAPDTVGGRGVYGDLSSPSVSVPLNRTTTTPNFLFRIVSLLICNAANWSHVRVTSSFHTHTLTAVRERDRESERDRERGGDRDGKRGRESERKW